MLLLSRNVFFYKDLKLKDAFETRIYLIFFHYSVILFILKKRGNKPDQKNYDSLFFYIENNLRQLGFGDVSVNKKMKDLNKIFYDILIKLSLKNDEFNINEKLLINYFQKLGTNNGKQSKLSLYFTKFYNFCFDLSSKNMIEGLKNFKY